MQAVLQEGLERVQSFFQKHNCRLPLSPSLVAKELNVKVRLRPVHCKTPIVSAHLNTCIYISDFI